MLLLLHVLGFHVFTKSFRKYIYLQRQMQEDMAYFWVKLGEKRGLSYPIVSDTTYHIPT